MAPAPVPKPAPVPARRRGSARWGGLVAFTFAIFGWAVPALADTTIPIDGTVTDEAPDHVFVEFEVPAGTAEIEVRHDDLDADDILDWGLYDPSGFRGWGGGNSEPIVVAEDAASRSYLTGPIQAGTWKVVIGKAKLVDGTANYHLEVVLKDAQTLAPQPEREPYVDPGAVVPEARWYAGDFHVHSRESGDAGPSIEEIVEFARGRGLDFVELSEHNTTSQLDFMNAAQADASPLLLIPGVEYTTYDGHANGIGATRFVDHKIGLPGVTIDAAADAFHDQGALFSINHPALDLGELCIGCAWGHELDVSKIDAVEVATAGSSVIFYDATIAFWEGLAAQGRRVAAVGGSDDHRAGVDEGSFGTPIGSPATMVYAEELSVAGILEGVRQARTVVKIRGPEDPMVELKKSSDGGTLSVVARVTGGESTQARWVVNGEPSDYVDVTSADQELVLPVANPAEGKSDRYRLEVWVGTQPVTLTSHLWIDHEDIAEPPPVEDDGCAAKQTSSPARWPLGVLAMVMLGFVVRRRIHGARTRGLDGRDR
ncbi:MAG: PHP domain-containing protein [Polyangiaceae bacterium]|nr:PHP domain-containing protein [Polyangiaceae bacterium]